MALDDVFFMVRQKSTDVAECGARRSVLARCIPRKHLLNGASGRVKMSFFWISAPNLSAEMFAHFYNPLHSLTSVSEAKSLGSSSTAQRPITPFYIRLVATISVVAGGTGLRLGCRVTIAPMSRPTRESSSVPDLSVSYGRAGSISCSAPESVPRTTPVIWANPHGDRNLYLPRNMDVLANVAHPGSWTSDYHRAQLQSEAPGKSERTVQQWVSA